MPQRRTIEGEAEVNLLVRSFYTKVFADELLKPFFTHLSNGDPSAHLEVMDRFWMNILFYTGGYQGNPMQAHQKMNQFKPLSSAHFKRWLELFYATVDELFEGEKATLAKERAYSIATVMQIKILESEKKSPLENIY